MRFIALSATLPNATDIGAFVGAEVFQFGEEYRPVPLQVCAGVVTRICHQHVRGNVLAIMHVSLKLYTSHSA